MCFVQNRYYREHHNLPTLQEAGRTVFRDVLFTQVKSEVTRAIITMINNEREGKAVDRSLLRQCVEVFEAMGEGNLEVYQDDFEAHLLDSTRVFYAAKSQEWITADTTPQYLVKATAALSEETSRVGAYLNAASEGPLLRVVERELLTVHQTALLEKEGSGLRVLLADKKKEDLARLYRLLSRVERGLVAVAAMVREYVQTAGLAIVREREAAIASGAKESANNPSFVKALLDLHDESKSLVTSEFSGNSLFQKALKDAFEVFVNKEVASKFSNAEMICTYTDSLLKTGGAKLSEAQVEEQLDRVDQLFSFISDKDLFAEIYRNQLAKRLLNQRSASDDAERSMISKLKLRCGAQYTGKMEGMLADLAVGADHHRDFKTFPGEQEDGGGLKIDFAMQVLTTGFWPTYKQLEVALPPVMARCQVVFRKYYDTKTSHRKLNWMYALGNATVKGFYAKVYDFQVTTLQAITMLVFNDLDGEIPFEAIRTAVNTDEEVMKRLLHSLSCGKYQFISKHPPGRTISTSDKFSFNSAFACPLRKIRIPMASLDDSHNPKRVQEDRSIAIEAAVVRTMKTRKTLSHQELVTEVISQLHFFRPNPKLIKRRIEHLIEREYLERDTDKANLYKYLA